ncbi:MAG: cation:dicarboxylase symporter family transporter [Bacteroidia bacterium]
MDCIQNNLKVPKSIANFVLPIGATVNMDRTSLYQAVAVVALAQFHMIDLSIAQQATIVLAATIASIGAAAIPSAGFGADDNCTRICWIKSCLDMSPYFL